MRPTSYKVGNRDTEYYVLSLEREIKSLTERIATVTGETKTAVEADYILGTPIYLPNSASIKFQLKPDRENAAPVQMQEGKLIVMGMTNIKLQPRAANVVHIEVDSDWYK